MFIEGRDATFLPKTCGYRASVNCHKPRRIIDFCGASMDRKALIRQYKETPRPMGVYRIRNTKTSQALIGTSLDVPSMLNRHRAQLGLGAHRPWARRTFAASTGS